MPWGAEGHPPFHLGKEPYKGRKGRALHHRASKVDPRPLLAAGGKTLIPLPSGRSVHTMGVVTFYLPEDQVGSCWGFWGLRPLILDYVRESRQGVG